MTATFSTPSRRDSGEQVVMAGLLSFWSQTSMDWQRFGLLVALLRPAEKRAEAGLPQRAAPLAAPAFISCEGVGRLAPCRHRIAITKSAE